MSQDFIIGTHSIAEAMKNPARVHRRLVSTTEGLNRFKKQVRLNDRIWRNTVVSIVGAEELQLEAQQKYQKRIPSQMFLQADPVEMGEPKWVYDRLDEGQELKLLALDNVTDIYNGAAVLRSAAFFGIDALILSMKGSFYFSPQFYRNSSGALEHVKVIKCINLSRMITSMQEMGVTCLGLTEDARDRDYLDDQGLKLPACLVLGNEERGISFAVMRALKHKVALVSQGKVSTLNVSVAAAIAIDRYLF